MKNGKIQVPFKLYLLLKERSSFGYADCCKECQAWNSHTFFIRGSCITQPGFFDLSLLYIETQEREYSILAAFTFAEENAKFLPPMAAYKRSKAQRKQKQALVELFLKQKRVACTMMCLCTQLGHLELIAGPQKGRNTYLSLSGKTTDI